LVLVVIGVWDYYRVFPSLAHIPFAENRVLTSSSYHALRRQVAQSGALPAVWRWTFPAGLASWQGIDSMFITATDDAAYSQVVNGLGGGLAVANLQIPAAVVQSVRVHAAFSGYRHFANVSWRRKGEQKLHWANFPVNRTGVPGTYEVPVSR